MVEWTRKVPSAGDRRISKRFCLWPYICSDNRVVWLGYRYMFQEYIEIHQQSRWWRTNFTLSPSQYAEFIEDLAIHTTSSDTHVREYANILLKQQGKR